MLKKILKLFSTIDGLIGVCSQSIDSFHAWRIRLKCVLLSEYQIVVDAMSGHELLMGAELGYLPIVKSEYHVGIENGREAMCDDDGGAAEPGTV